MSASLVGQDGPNVISTDQFGKQQELLAKNRIHCCLSFNPDCENCQKETPLLHEFYLKNKSNVDVFAIAIDTDDAEWRDYIKQKIVMDQCL